MLRFAQHDRVPVFAPQNRNQKRRNSSLTLVLQIDLTLSSRILEEARHLLMAHRRAFNRPVNCKLPPRSDERNVSSSDRSFGELERLFGYDRTELPGRSERPQDHAQVVTDQIVRKHPRRHGYQFSFHQLVTNVTRTDRFRQPHELFNRQKSFWWSSLILALIIVLYPEKSRRF